MKKQPIGEAFQIGDVITYTLPVMSNTEEILSFIDSIEGITVDRYFTKQFRYAVEGLFWSNWVDLSYFPVETLELDFIHSYIFQIQYTRAGTDNTGVLTLNSFSFETITHSFINGKEFDDSNFAQFFNTTNSDVENWALNVLKKIYYKGSLAEYVLRGKGIVEVPDLEAPPDNSGLDTDDGIQITDDSGNQLEVD